MAVSGTRRDHGLLNKLYSWAALHPRSALCIVALVALVPFVAKPFNMDDPLFIWAARHICAHPANPYGFEVNWFGTATPMWDATKNPPLACYYLAMAGGVLGWSEPVLHGALLLPALAVILGTYRLARHFCQRPMLAALITLITPAFMVSATTVMCDLLMLAFWVWAVVLWVEGLGAESMGRLCWAGFLIALATLTKYYGVSLIPMLLVYSVLKRRLGKWLLPLLIPVAALCAYTCWTRALYGHVLFGEAMGYAHLPKGFGALLAAKSGAGLTALAFTGGCLAGAAFFAPLLWRLRSLIIIAASSVLLSVALLGGGVLLKDYGPLQGTTRLFLQAQIILWAVGGASIIALVIRELWSNRDANAWLLGLWVVGTFLFAAVVNWTVNGRSILPMAPAVAILLVRRLERTAHADGTLVRLAPGVCLACGAIIAFLVTIADYRFALAGRESARQTFEKYGRGPARFWFQGHWGYQYYMEALGTSALDGARTQLRRGDIIAIPENNTNFLPIKPQLAVLREILRVPGPDFLATMKGEVGAGFYASIRGPLPFAFGNPPPDLVTVLALEPPSPK